MLLYVEDLFVFIGVVKIYRSYKIMPSYFNRMYACELRHCLANLNIIGEEDLEPNRARLVGITSIIQVVIYFPNMTRREAGEVGT